MPEAPLSPAALEPITYYVPCMVSAKVTLSPAGRARVEECVGNVIGDRGYSVEEARHLVLMDLVDWMGVHGRYPSQVDGFADLADDDIVVSREEWQPNYVEDVEVIP